MRVKKGKESTSDQKARSREDPGNPEEAGAKQRAKSKTVKIRELRTHL